MEFSAHISVAAEDDAVDEEQAKRIEKRIITVLNRIYSDVEVNVEVDE